MDASKSEKLEGDSQESTQFRDEEGLLYLKSNTADMICNQCCRDMVCNRYRLYRDMSEISRYCIAILYM